MKAMKLVLPIFILLLSGQYLNAQDNIHDADNNTKVETERTANNDLIYFKTGGTDRWRMIGSRLEPQNTGNSIFLGVNAGRNDDLTNNQNVFLGTAAGDQNTSGFRNFGLGYTALRYNISGYDNVAIGSNSLNANTTGYWNTGIGSFSLQLNTTGQRNTGIGLSSFYKLAAGNDNTGIGPGSMFNTTSGSNNTSVGALAGYYVTSGSNNTFVGQKAGYVGSNHSKSGSVFIGYQAGYNETTSNKLYIDNSSTSNPLIYGDFATNKVGINGKLGIGLENPTGLFDVSGVMPGARFSQIETTNIGSANDLFELQVQAGAPDGGQFIEFQRGSTIEARINTDGSAEFESAELMNKNSASGNGNLIIQNGVSGGYARVTYKDNSGSDYWDHAARASGATSRMNFWYHDGTSGADVMSLDGPNKRVGVGTLNPIARLHVTNSTSSTGNGVIYSESTYTGNSDRKAVRGKSVNNPGYGYGGYFEGGFRGVYGYANATTYTGSAIGVYGNATATGAVGTRYGVYGSASGAANNYAVYGSGDVKASSQMFIGTTTTMESAASTYELLVDGEIICEELKVENSNTWPDYVFDTKYELPSLEEVDAFIKENKHLPNIPSAKVIESEGFLIGEMHNKTIEKVEELTLYAIDANKRIKALEKQNQDLQQAVKDLMSQLQKLNK